MPLTPIVYYLVYLIPIYFNFAVIYDLFTTIYELATKGAPLPWEHSGPGVLIPIEDAGFQLYSNQTTEIPVLEVHTDIP